MNENKKSHTTTYIFLGILTLLVVVFFVNWTGGSDSGWFTGIFALLGIVVTLIVWPIVAILERASNRRAK